MKKGIFLIAMFSLAVLPAKAKQDVNAQNNNGGSNKVLKTVEELCAPARSQTDLDLNNVRARILGGGDMWWDLNSNPRYEIPKGGNRHSMFSGALWLGGYDDGGQLKLAAMTYRQRGNDYWPGPLSNDGLASVTKEICDAYDNHWVLNREEVEMHAAWIACKNNPDCNQGDAFPGYITPRSIVEWPGDGIIGRPNQPRLAPYIDVDGDGVWNYEEDYPAYDINKEFDCRLKETDLLYGDQTIWYVYNDRGNIHTETNAGSLGFEIRFQAFSFSTNDEINDMTFYNYRILNKSTFRLADTYFSTWFDPDLGNPIDDIIGCDIPRGLGYVYNSRLIDPGPLGYGANPPAIGFDFFQGPFADYFDGLDNNRDGCVDGVRDENGICVPEDPATGVNERIIMSGFMYYNNTNDVRSGNPRNGPEFYNYMQSRWRNGDLLVINNPCGPGCSGNGNGIGSGPSTLFAYFGTTYDTTRNNEPSTPLNPGWFESPDNREDKRGLHNAGPFSLAPGALNFITTGAVWARDFTREDLFASVEKLIVADDKAQSLFDNCFEVLDGPDAPDVDLVELDGELILNLTYGPTSNNFKFSYRETDPLIVTPDTLDRDTVLKMNPNYYDYIFEGFQVFQLRNREVGIGDIYDAAQARLVAQTDVKNGITQLINWEVDPDMNQLVPRNMTLQANNAGVRTSFRFTEDAFASGNNRRLVNEREYYYTVIAYSYNQFKRFDPTSAPDGQRLPFLAGRRNIQTYTGIPHLTTSERGGQRLSSRYGDTPPITRIEGEGNMDRVLRLTPESERELLENDNVDYITYQANAGPLNIKVVDPKEVPTGRFTVTFDGASDSSRWTLSNATTGREWKADTTIGFFNEQIIPELGLSVNIFNTLSPGNDTTATAERNQGILPSQRIFSDPSNQWLSAQRDVDGTDPRNWILAGANRSSEGLDALYQDFPGDPFSRYATIIDGTWAPYVYTAPNVRENTDNGVNYGMGPRIARSDLTTTQFNEAFSRLRSVDIVFTNDPSKWTRVPILELGEDPLLTQGGAQKFDLRNAPGLRQENPNSRNLVQDADNPGWTVFPGYAIDVETGKRLNIIVGENSWMVSDNGRDMRWNPTARVRRELTDDVTNGWRFGGQHYIYVMSARSNTGADISYKGPNPQDNPFYTLLQNMRPVPNRRNLFRNAMWVNIPLLSPQYPNVDPYSSMPSDVRVELRMANPFKVYQVDNSNQGRPKYEFDLDGLAARRNQTELASSFLDSVRIVPNPYYGGSRYETGQLETIVKVINLPERCNINIFSTNGTLIRQLRKDNNLTYIEWDMKNRYNVPIASGVYIFHIDAGELGETVVKWFGSLRPVDLNAF